jgi:response regulator of citrate/malate metabolism
VDILLITAAGASRQVDGPMEVGTVGVLVRPLRSFTLG